MYNLLLSSEVVNDELVIDVIRFKQINKVKNIKILLEKLMDYGFYSDDISLIKKLNKVHLSYPDNRNVLTLWKMMTDKSNINNRLKDFLCCHYKLLQDDMNTVNYGYGIDTITDRLHTNEQKEFVYVMHKTLIEMGYFYNLKEWNEGPGCAYYKNEATMRINGIYHFCVLSWKTELVLFLRIRNATKCLEYLNECPSRIKEIFLQNDEGCSRRRNGTCVHGIQYTLDGVNYWRCGCCTVPFRVNPVIEDIPHYLKLVELGFNK